MRCAPLSLLSLGVAWLLSCSQDGRPARAQAGAQQVTDGGADDAAFPSPEDASAPGEEDAGADSAPPDARVTCAGKTGAGGDLDVSLDVSGTTRTFSLHVPASYDPGDGMPLVLAFHGFSMDAATMRNMSQLQVESDGRGFLLAFPQGVGNSWNAGDCCGRAVIQHEDDTGFFRAMLAKIEADYCVDAKRIFVAGFSNGAFFAHRLACEMANVVAAIAPVSGVLGMPPEACTPSRQVPVLEFHGTADQIVPYDGGAPLVQAFPPPAPQFRSVAETNEAWRDKNGCGPVATTTYAQGDATCRNWQCAAGTEVELCTIDGGGHTWPGGRSGAAIPGLPGEGKISTSISASERIADFFARHALP